MTPTILIELPRSLIIESNRSKGGAGGANKIAKILADNLIAAYKKMPIVIVSDATPSEFSGFKQNRNLILADYPNLLTTLEENRLSAQFAFINDLKAHIMMGFRNIHRLKFPVIGLIHSLGPKGSVDDLLRVKALMSKSDILICPSKSTQKTAIKLGVSRKQTKVIGYGVDTSKFKPPTKKADAKKKLRIAEHKDVMLVLSRINPSMKMDLVPLIRQLPTLIKKHPNALLMIVGTADDAEYVEQVKQWVKQLKLTKHVKWVTKPNHGAIETYYQSSDIFISLSDNLGETFGLTVIEAMASSLPVVISDYDGYQEHLKDTENGFYIPTIGGAPNLDTQYYSNSSKAFGDAWAQSIAMDNQRLMRVLNDLLSHKAKRKKVGSNARKSVKTLKEMILDYQHCFNSAAKAPALPPRPKLKDVQALVNHFPSRLLKSRDTLKITPYGQAIAEGKEDFFGFTEHLNQRPGIAIILKHLYYEDIHLAKLEKQTKIRRDVLEMHILYMLKHDLIRIKD